MKKQAGITLLEVVVALGIMSVVVAGTAALIERSSADTRAAVAAQQLRTVGDAANVYIKDNYTAVAANATATQPALIRVSDLVAGGYLTAGATTANAYQQNQCVLVLEPSANNLTALVVTEGGTTIDDITLGGVAALIGASGGGIYSSATTTVRGAMGGWSIATGNYANANHLGQHCDGTAGAVTLAAGHPAQALWFADGNITSGFLYRDAVPGHPELNRMNTTLDMNGNAISNAATVQLNTVVASGAACTTNGVLARDASGAVMSCQSLQWKSQGSAYWQDPVANFASLPACNAAIAWQTRVAQTPTVGSGPRAYTCNGATWQPIAVDNSGNMTIAGTATVGQAQINTVVVENTACGSNGLVARDATGLLLSCQSGVWKNASGSGGTGMSGILTPLKGKTISCAYTCYFDFGGYGTTGTCYAYAYVDGSGAPFTKTVSSGTGGWADANSGWVAGFSAATPYTLAGWGLTNGLSGGIRMAGTGGCGRQWPPT